MLLVLVLVLLVVMLCHAPFDRVMGWHRELHLQ
jgi:hypothetical protein